MAVGYTDSDVYARNFERKYGKKYEKFKNSAHWLGYDVGMGAFRELGPPRPSFRCALVWLQRLRKGIGNRPPVLHQGQ